MIWTGTYPENGLAQTTRQQVRPFPIDPDRPYGINRAGPLQNLVKQTAEFTKFRRLP